MAVAVGQPAPDFELPDQHGSPVRLSALRGQQAAVVVFYPLAFTGTCTGELAELQENLTALQNDDVRLFAVSCDAMPSLRVFAEQEKLDYPLLSDFWPHGATATAYGVFADERGFALRGTFVIDRSGIVRWTVLNPAGEARDVDDYTKALAEL
jgi:peroxiredoxin